MSWCLQLRKLKTRSNLTLSFFTHNHNSILQKPTKIHFPEITAFNSAETPILSYRCFSISSNFSVNVKPPQYSANECESGEEHDDNELELSHVVDDERLIRDVSIVMDTLRESGTSLYDVKTKLDQCDVSVSSELVVAVLSRLNSDWEPAFAFFLWASGKKPDYTHSLREYHAMIYILGKARKFDTAWSLVDEMQGGRSGSSLVTPHTLLIMIRRYSAVHNVAKVISTFSAHKRFGFRVGIEEFQNFLCALCRYKNVEDAEHLLFCNKNVFPFNTKSFNIILNGWCNVIGSPREGERFWVKMIKSGIKLDVVSFSSIISCYSKASNLNKVLRLYDQMKAMNISPDRRAYNAVIHALTKAKHVKEALNLIRKMEETNINPNTVTYNSLIKPLCKAQKIDEARKVFDEMVLRGVSPTVQTYHAFFRNLRTSEEVFMLLDKMKMTGCHPNIDTYIMLIRKFCRWRQLDNVFKLWNLIIDSGICPDRSSYIVLIHGLFLNGKLEEANKYYIEMKEKQLIPESKIDEKLQAWLSGKQTSVSRMIDLNDKMKEKQIMDEKLQEPVSDKQLIKYGRVDCTDDQGECKKISHKSRVGLKTVTQESASRREPETKRVLRVRGFSFWE